MIEKDKKAYTSNGQYNNPQKDLFCFNHSATSTIITSALSKPLEADDMRNTWIGKR